MFNLSNLEKMIDDYTDDLLRLAFYYVKDLQAAEDIVQEVFIKFYETQNLYKEQGELKAYLKKLTVNKSLDYLKSWNYRKVSMQNKLVALTKGKRSDYLVKKDEQTLIGDAILELPLKQREVLIYFYFEEWTIAEIAAFLSIPQSTVKTRLRRGKELLRPKLEGIEWEVLMHE